MYFVDRKKLEATLQFIERQTATFENLTKISGPIEKNALERIVHSTIEAVIDVGNALIDGFIMRDPGSYHDIIDILIDEKVIPTEHESSYKQLIDLRQMLVQDYLSVDHDKIKDVLFTNKEKLMGFSKHVKTYLDNELGVANAFSNEES